MKKTEDKMQVAKAWYEAGQPIDIILQELDISRGTLYFWLNEMGVTRGSGPKGGRLSDTKKYALMFGVSMPTARRYKLLMEKYNLQKGITIDDLRALGISKVTQIGVCTFLSKMGYSFKYADKTLTNQNKRSFTLTLTQIADIFLNPNASIETIERSFL